MNIKIDFKTIKFYQIKSNQIKFFYFIKFLFELKERLAPKEFFSPLLGSIFHVSLIEITRFKRAKRHFKKSIEEKSCILKY